MKKKFLRIGVLVVVLAVLLVTVLPVSAGTKTTFEYEQFIDGVEDPGVWTVLPSGNIHIRGMVLLLHDTATDPRLVGNARVVLNANYDANLNGPAWGTSHFVSAEGGVWDLTWEGMSVANVPVSLHGQAEGSEKYDGMKLWCDLTTATVIEH